MEIGGQHGRHSPIYFKCKDSLIGLKVFSRSLHPLSCLLVLRLPSTFVNYFGNCDAIAALCWSSALATWVAIVMLLVQRIFSFAEFMEVSLVCNYTIVVTLSVGCAAHICSAF